MSNKKEAGHRFWFCHIFICAWVKKWGATLFEDIVVLYTAGIRGKWWRDIYKDMIDASMLDPRFSLTDTRDLPVGSIFYLDSDQESA